MPDWIIMAALIAVAVILGVLFVTRFRKDSGMEDETEEGKVIAEGHGAELKKHLVQNNAQLRKILWVETDVKEHESEIQIETVLEADASSSYNMRDLEYQVNEFNDSFIQKYADIYPYRIQMIFKGRNV